MVREGLSFVSHLPIAMDGSCNGLQLFSLMLRDPVGGTAVNLLPADTPQDIYRLVADKIIAKLERDRTGGEERLDQEVRTKRTGQALYKPRSVAGLFLSLGIDRSATKRQVMVLPYYGTRESCREYTAQWLKEKLFASPQPLPEGCTQFGLAVYLAGLIWEAIGETVVAARDAMAYLQSCATVMSRAGKPIRWTMPACPPRSKTCSTARISATTSSAWTDASCTSGLRISP